MIGRRRQARSESLLSCVRPGAFVVLVFLAATAPGLADIVYLKNGQHLEGDVSDGRDGKLRVTIDEGIFFEFSREDIERIQKKKSPASVFDKRLSKISGDGIEELGRLVELARWARDRRLRSRVKKAFRRVLEIDPNHPGARRALGFFVYRNRWVHEKDLEAKGGLVEFEGEWMTPAEKERRLVDELRREVHEDFRGVVSENRFIQDYSIRRLLERDNPHMREIFTEFLDHSNSVARVVAVQALSRGYNRVRGSTTETRKASRKKKREERTPPPERATEVETLVAASLLKMTLNETEREARRALFLALSHMRHRTYFELALKAAWESPKPIHRDRAANGILFALSKPWVPEVISALGRVPVNTSDAEGNPAILRILKEIFPVDFGYRVDRWLAWWRESAHRYENED